ncbi:MAG: cytochrome c biogenesis protein CcsA [Chloroflexota bacterium]|nr:cytochrome c biogenesis protein CcsA [Chloroflexota bacterium]
MYYIGTSLIFGAILAAVFSSACYTLVVSGRSQLLRWGRVGAYGALLLAGASALLILALFVLQRYDIRYVYDYSSRELELRYRIAAVWAGQPGSLVVWALAGLIIAPFLMRRTRHYEPYVLALLMMLQAMLIVFMLIRNPFLPTEPVVGMPYPPQDGRGLNPQLHNVWMVIHPPTLFIGYGLLGIPFCMALAGLWRRDYDGWAQLALPWTVAGWTILGLALTMGGYWAYESLGWGGYWGWDPVENSSLVPWLTGAALMHGLLVQRTHGGLRRANFFLAILTYGLVFYASFLTRSGVLSQFSVHSFVEEGLKAVMLGAMLTLVVFGSGLLLLRWRDVPRKPLSEALLSRDTVFVLLMLTFVIVGLVIAFGTSMPWITSIKGLSYNLEQFFGRAFNIDNGTQFGGQPFTDGRFSLMPDFFKSTTSPLALVLAMLMAIGPLLGWRNTDGRKLLLAVRWPFAAAVVLTSVGIFLGVRHGLSVAFVAVASFALGTNLLMIVRTLRSGWLRIGGYLAHVGMALLLVGVVGSYVYASPEEKVVIPQGETQCIFEHCFSFWGYDEKPNGKHVLRLEVARDGGEPFIAAPDVYFNARMGADVRTPAIKRYLWQDLYISPEQYLPAVDLNSAEVVPGVQQEIGPYSMRFDKFDVQDHLATDKYAIVQATVTVTYENEVQVLTPQLRLEADKVFTEVPVALPDGKSLVLENINPGAQMAKLRVDGLNLPPVPARAVFTVSTKPAIALVWLGALLMAFGGALAVVRRRWVQAPAPEVVRSGGGALGTGALGWRGTYR